MNSDAVTPLDKVAELTLQALHKVEVVACRIGQQPIQCGVNPGSDLAVLPRNVDKGNWRPIVNR